METRRIWLITGANRGLGRALVEKVLDVGDIVIATVRGPSTLVEHDRLVVRRLDVRDRPRARGVVEDAIEQFGRLDVLVNNAGYGLIGAVEEVGEDEARAIVDTNLFGALWLSQVAVEVMRPRGQGHIVQISTVGAVGTMPTLGLYNAAKWGLEGFSEALAAEVDRFGIRVTIVEPGGIDTEWATGSMHFSRPSPAYDELRVELFGTSDVPWTTAGTGGGARSEDVAAAILGHVTRPIDNRLRLLVGEDAPAHVVAALDARRVDYSHDVRFVSASAQDFE